MRINYFLSIFKSYRLPKDVKICVRYSSKSLLGDKITPLTENTLLGRMMLYLNNNLNSYNYNGKFIESDSVTIESLIHTKANGLRSLNIDQIIGVFYSANTSILSHNKQNLRKILDLLDTECCLRINTMESKNILKILSALMHVVPNRITEYKFYQYATDDIDRCFNFSDKKELLEFIFYVGLQKKPKKAQGVLKKCLKIINKEYLDSLTIEDICIICNSTYRTKTKISSTRFLEKVKYTLNENLFLLKDPALLITLIKTIKHNHCQDDDLLNTISCTVFFNRTAQYYTFTAMSRILSLYADYLYYDEELLNLFTEKCVKHLEESNNVKSKAVYLSEQPRAKDLTEFLCSISLLGYTKIDQKILRDVIVPKIKERVTVGEYTNNPYALVDAVLYLWMLNYHAKELIPHALSHESIAAIAGGPAKRKLNLNLLLTLIKHEDEQLYKNLNIKPVVNFNYNPNQQVQSRPSLQKICQVLKTISCDMELNHIETNCQVPYLNIVGISGYNENMKTAVNVEVLDEYTSVKNKEFYPSGLMQLKLRILEQSNVPLITVQKDEIDSMTEFELKEFLEDEIKLYC